MGCGSSKTTAVQAIRSEEVNESEDETGSKHGGRGDSAVSKVTTDSGVVMENREIPVLPGSVSTKPPPLTGLLQHESTALERLNSSEILEELLTQGIIPVGQPREKGSGAGEAYSIMLDDREGAKRRPPARLESLKARDEQSPTSREAIDEKMRQAEERRKLREDELKTRLRTKSAHVRGPASTSMTLQKEDPALTTVEPLHTPLTPQLTPDPTGTPQSHENLRDPPLHTQVREATHRAAEGAELVREAGGDGREGGGGGAGDKADNRGETDEERMRGGSERESGDGGRYEEDEEEGEEEEEEEGRVEELESSQLLRASGELESDSTFHHDNEKIF